MVFNLICLLLLALSVQAFQFGTTTSTRRNRLLSMDSDLFAESQNESKLLPGQLPCSNYLASNRFKVRNGKIAAFDKRWADRTSRLAELNGFKFFSLLRRVEEFGITYDEKNDKYNYLSFTIWENKENFNEWRTGEAFKEAHGGGSIIDFAKLIGTALFILDGKPVPAFYDNLKSSTNQINLQNLKNSLNMKNGWRTIEADGKTEVPPDAFVVAHRMKVAEDVVQFENSYNLDEFQSVDGFITSYFVRRDKPDDGYNYICYSFWKDKSTFTAFNKSSSNKFKAVDSYYEGKLVLIGK